MSTLPTAGVRTIDPGPFRLRLERSEPPAGSGLDAVRLDRRLRPFGPRWNVPLAARTGERAAGRLPVGPRGQRVEGLVPAGDRRARPVAARLVVLAAQRRGAGLRRRHRGRPLRPRRARRCRRQAGQDPRRRAGLARGPALCRRHDERPAGLRPHSHQGRHSPPGRPLPAGREGAALLLRIGRRGSGRAARRRVAQSAGRGAARALALRAGRAAGAGRGRATHG